MKVAIVEDEIRIREGIEKLLKKLNRRTRLSPSRKTARMG